MSIIVIVKVQGIGCTHAHCRSLTQTEAKQYREHTYVFRISSWLVKGPKQLEKIEKISTISGTRTS